ncbi:MAG TPA: hypothetical protein VJC12_01175 [Candidatus Paceibacterota bacterium]
MNHSEILKKRWGKFSVPEQMANIGSEVGRAAKWQGKDEQNFWSAVERALELFDFTLSNSKLGSRLHEIGLAKEVFCDTILGGREYNDSLSALEEYFMGFAYLVQNKVRS